MGRHCLPAMPGSHSGSSGQVFLRLAPSACGIGHGKLLNGGRFEFSGSLITSASEQERKAKAIFEHRDYGQWQERLGGE